MKIILDTNCYLRYILADIPAQADQVETLLKKAKLGKIKIVLPLVVILEIHYVLLKYYKLEKKQVIEKIKQLINQAYIEVEEKNIIQLALSIYSEKSISFIDSLLKAKSQSQNIKLFT